MEGEQGYLDLVRLVLEKGESRTDRTGVGTTSLFGAQLKFDLANGFPLLTTKRVFFRGVVEELLWMLNGETNSKLLAEKGVHIWDDNGSRQFLDSRGLTENTVGDLGPIYGYQWRHFGSQYPSKEGGIDQIQEALRLIRTDPDSRRIVISSWNPCDLHKMALPPCHLLCQFSVSGDRNRLSCSMYQRSADLALGVPFNIASYALLTHLMAYASNLQVGELVMSFGDVHIYNNHIDGIKEQLARVPRDFPYLVLAKSEAEKKPWQWESDEITVANYEPYPPIKLKMAV